MKFHQDPDFVPALLLSTSLLAAIFLIGSAHAFEDFHALDQNDQFEQSTENAQNAPGSSHANLARVTKAQAIELLKSNPKALVYDCQPLKLGITTTTKTVRQYTLRKK